MNKNITNIKYNHLNQPTEIDFGKNKTKYIYTATGLKLQTKIYEEGKLKSKTDYSGAYVYENDELSYTNIQGGRIAEVSGKGFSRKEYQYHLTDHLGNVRVTFTKGGDGNGQIIQEDHYYPFGMRMSRQHYSNTELINKYLYNGKEQQDQTKYYDYGFRQFDAQLGRWHVVDAISEKYFSTSPYAYVENNPVSYKDLLGLKKYKSQQLKNNDRELQMQKFYDNLQGSLMFGSAGSHTMSGAGIREAGPTSAAVDAFFAMGGGREGSSVSDWYAAGGRAGMSLEEYGAINNVINDPSVKGFYGHDGKGTLYSLTIDGIGSIFFGNGVKTSSVINNGNINWGGVANNYSGFRGVEKSTFVSNIIDWVSNNVKFNSSFDASFTIGLQGGHKNISAGTFAHELLGIHYKTGSAIEFYYSEKGNINKTKHYISIPFISWTQDVQSPTNWYMNQEVTTINKFQFEYAGFIMKFEFDGSMNFQHGYVGSGFSFNATAILGLHIDYFKGLKF